MKKTKGLFILSLMLCFIFLTGLTARALDKNKASGLLTLIESDGTVEIDERGYILNHYTRILNSGGRVISPDSLTPPVHVSFEYEYEQEGPVISLMQVIPQ